MSMGIMGISPIFANAAGRGGKKAGGNTITLIGVKEDPIIYELSCSGEITVESVKNGEAVIQTYSDLSSTQVSIQADADSTVVIKGDVTKYDAGQYQGWGYADGVCAKQLAFNNNVIEFISGVSGISSSGDTSVVTSINVSGCTALTHLNCSSCSALTALDVSKNTALTQLDCGGCHVLTALDLSNNTALTQLGCNSCSALTTLDLSNNTALTQLECALCSALTTLDLSKNTALTYLDCSSCSALTTLDLSNNTALTQLSCYGCSVLTALDLSTNTALTQLSCNDCAKLISISYPATNEDVSTAVAGAITAADSATGTVYTDSAAAYYSTIETAATDKGWTIEQIAA